VRVLLVDDEPDNLESLTLFFKDSGAVVLPSAVCLLLFRRYRNRRWV